MLHLIVVPSAISQQEQWEKAWIEFEYYGDPDDRHDIVMTYNNSGTDGQWYRPSIDYVTRAWSYNVYKINNKKQEKDLFRTIFIRISHSWIKSHNRSFLTAKKT